MLKEAGKKFGAATLISPDDGDADVDRKIREAHGGNVPLPTVGPCDARGAVPFATTAYFPLKAFETPYYCHQAALMTGCCAQKT